MRDGVSLLADVYLPDGPGPFPVLIAASPYPRQIQDLGAPMGFIEAGASDFFVPRGYVHVIANLRGTGGSGGEFGFFDSQERRDMHDLVEWAAAQSWCDGNVGMIGISYFAMTQLEAAVERPAALKAIFPVAVTSDLYDAAHHHGLFNSSFVTPFLAMIGITSAHGDKLWRGKALSAARHVLNTPALHKKFATLNGEASVTLLHAAMRAHYDPHPWDDLWQDIAVNHQLRDQWWDDRNLMPLLERVTIPVYLGCDWQNVPLHLPSTFTTYGALTNSPEVRMTLLGDFGLTWPWESLHVEALAWFDHYLKGADTGILDGPPIRYVLPGSDGWRTSDAWPPASDLREFWLRADGVLGDVEGEAGARTYVTLGPNVGRDDSKASDPESSLTWTSGPLVSDLDMAGHIELELTALSTFSETAWIATLQDVSPDGTATDVTAGFLRASLREIDSASSSPGLPVLPCRTAVAVPPGDEVTYRIPLVANARRFAAGNRLRLVLCSDDQPAAMPAIMGFRHASTGASSRNTVLSSSRLLLPILADTGSLPG